MKGEIVSLYDFRCPEHGKFEAYRSLSQVAEEIETNEDLAPEPCPTCGEPSTAVFSPQGLTVNIPRRFRDPIRKEDVW
jgi:predicted RNA-binding Zn-ribbon protein involved in translation (DUF1610 family)